MEEKILQDLCRDAKSRLNMTNQDIADVSGVPISTVKNFFAASSKSPSVYTVAPICSALGVSIDAALNIVGAATPQEIHERDLRIAYLEGRLAQTERSAAAAAKLDRQRRAYTIALLCLCVVLVAVVIAYISFDASIGYAGLIQGNDISVFAFALMAIVLVTVFVMAKLLIGIVKRNAPTPIE